MEASEIKIMRRLQFAVFERIKYMVTAQRRMFLLTAIIATTLCISDIHLLWADNSPRTQAKSQKLHQLADTIIYRWKNNSVLVTFERMPESSSWEMEIRGTKDVDSPIANEEAWGYSSSSCSLSECLQIINKSLDNFHAQRPNTRVTEVDMKMNVVKEIWSEILHSLQATLSSLPGNKASIHDPYNDNMLTDPSIIGSRIQLELERSTATASLERTLNKRGIRVTRCIAENDDPFFKDSLTGRKWEDLANLSGLGIARPGLITFYEDRPLVKRFPSTSGR